MGWFFEKFLCFPRMFSSACEIGMSTLCMQFGRVCSVLFSGPNPSLSPPRKHHDHAAGMAALAAASLRAFLSAALIFNLMASRALAVKFFYTLQSFDLIDPFYILRSSFIFSHSHCSHSMHDHIHGHACIQLGRHEAMKLIHS